MKSEKRRVTRAFVVSTSVIFLIYVTLLIVEGLSYHGNIETALVTFFVGTPILAIAVSLYIKFPNVRYGPFYICLLAHVAFFIGGAFLRELEFFFLFMLLLVGILTTLKDFKVLLYFILSTFVFNCVAVFGMAPNVEWINWYRFLMHFFMATSGSVLMLLQTYNVSQKESRSESALSAFSSLLNSTPNLLVITSADSRVRYLSDPMAEFIGYTNKDFAIGQPLVDLIADDGLKMMFADMLDANGLYEMIKEIDFKGETRYFNVIADKLTGLFEGTFIDITDITPTILNNLALKEAQLAAEEASKSKTDFLASMSHEIRTPMNAIIGVTQIELLNGDLTERTANALEMIYSSGNNLLGIINDILDMSKIETGKLELNLAQYDTPSLINDAVQLNIVRIGSRRIEFLLGIDENLPLYLVGDELRLKQILNNLLSNAIKYTDSGHVRLSVFHTMHGEDVKLHFAVEDTGQGMSPEDQKKLFTEFLRFNVSQNRTVEGTGLGLNITKNLVGLMDGTISVESEYGVGSTFTVTVIQKAVGSTPIGPKIADQLKSFTFTGNRQAAITQFYREPMPYGSVLVVDDVATNLFVAKGLLIPYQLKIDTVDSGFRAIERIKAGKTYDIVFMDHMMPKMDGMVTTHRLRELGYKGVIVALTANAIIGNEGMFMQNGFDGFISKPIDIRQLNATLNHYVRDAHPEEAKKHKNEVITESLESSDAKTEISLQIKHIFCIEAARAITTIKGTLAAGDMKLFTTTIHGMKSALANIGEYKASALAGVLEDYGQKENIGYIAANISSFIDTLEVLIKNHTPPPEETAAVTDLDEDTDFLSEQLEAVKNACEEYDILAANAALDQLEERQWNTDTAVKIKKIRESLAMDSDFEAAAAAAGEIPGGIV